MTGRYMGLTDLAAMMNSVSETTVQADLWPTQECTCVRTTHMYQHAHIHKIIFISQKESQSASLLSGLWAPHPTHLLPFSYLYGL